MGALKLTYIAENPYPMRVIWSSQENKNLVQEYPLVDPLTKSYPFYSPYQFASNTPIWAIDLDGLESFKANKNLKSEPNSIVLKLVNAEEELSVDWSDKTIKTDPFAIKEVQDFIGGVQVNPNEKIISFGDETSYKYQLPIAEGDNKQGIIGTNEIAKHISGDFDIEVKSRIFGQTDDNNTILEAIDEVVNIESDTPNDFNQIDVFVKPELQEKVLEILRKTENLEGVKINLLDKPSKSESNSLEIIYKKTDVDVADIE